MRAAADAQLAFVLGVGQLFVGVDVLALDLDLVVHDHARTGRKAIPRDAAIGRGCAVQAGGNGVFQHLGFDRQEQAVLFAAPQAGGIHQQDHVGGRSSALGLQARDDAGVVRVHAVDLDAGSLGEVVVQRLIGAVVTRRIQVENLLLGAGGAAKQAGRHNGKGHVLLHKGLSFWNGEELETALRPRRRTSAPMINQTRMVLNHGRAGRTGLMLGLARKAHAAGTRAVAHRCSQTKKGRSDDRPLKGS